MGAGSLVGGGGLANGGGSGALLGSGIIASSKDTSFDFVGDALAAAKQHK